MEPEKPKRKVRKKTSKIINSAPILNLQQELVMAKQAIHKGNKYFIKIAEKSGIPEGYASTVAWFAERMILATALLIAISFASGVMYTLYLSEPIAQSEFANNVSQSATLASAGLRAYKEYVIDIASPIFGDLIKANREEVDMEAEKLAARKEKLKNYLILKKSPFAEDEAALDAFINSKNMKLMVAISFVESTFGKHCYYYNCSGIGGTPPNLRKYNSYAEWIVDFDSLLERRYKDVPPEKFIGLYVQPGSANWLYGVKQVISEFDEHGIEAGITIEQ